MVTLDANGNYVYSGGSVPINSGAGMAYHPRGTRLGLAAAGGGGGAGPTVHPKGTRLGLAAQLAAQTSGENSSTATPAGGSTVVVTGGDGAAAPAGGGKSGKTLAARAQGEFLTSVQHWVIVGGLILLGVWAARRFVFDVRPRPKFGGGGGGGGGGKFGK